MLANEQVIDGTGWRSGAPVEERELTQWFFTITDYSEDLLAALEDARPLAGEGPADAAELDRPLGGPAGPLRARPRRRRRRRYRVEVFTTRPDTLFGASFIALSPDHPLAAACRGEEPGAAEFIEECHHLGTAAAAIEKAEKLGFDTGCRPSIPSMPDRLLPVYVANFVLMDYGTGAIFGCPAHDQRDLDFANKYGLR